MKKINLIYSFKKGENLLTQQVEGLGMCHKKSKEFIQDTTLHIESKMFLHQLLNTISKPIFLKDDRHIYLLVNDAFCKFLGCRRNQIIGKSEYEIFPPQTANLIWHEDEQVLRSGIASEKSETFTDATGKILNICTKKSILNKSDGKKILVGEIQVSDITESKHAENELRRNKLLIEKIADSAPQILYIYDLNRGQNIYANRQIYEILGYQQEEIKQKGNQWVLETIHPEDLPAFLESANRCYHIADGEVIVAEFRQKSADGSWRWFNCRNAIFSRNADGLPEHIIGTAQDITERKSIEIALAESQAKLQAIINNTSDGILIIDLQGYVRFANPAAIDLFGRPSEKLLNHELGLPIAGSETVELNIIHSSGKIAIGEMSLAETQWNGESAYVVSLRDITKRREAEDALRESEMRFRQLAENVDDLFWLFCLQTRQMLYASPAYEQIWGISRENLYRNPFIWVESLYPEDRIIAHHNLVKQLEGEATSTEYRIVRPDGEIRWIFKRDFPIKNEDGEIYRIAGIVEDITKRKLTEEALAKEKAHLIAAQKVGHVGSWEFDVLKQQIAWSDETFRIFGLTPEQSSPSYSEHLQKQIHPDDRTLWETTVQEAIANGKSYEFEFRILHPDRQIRHVFTKGKPIFDERGQVIQLFGTVLDITAYKQAEQSLRESEEQFRTIFELAPIGIGITALDGQFIRVNKALCTSLGYNPDEMRSLKLTDLIHPDFLPASIAFQKKLLRGEISHFQIETCYLDKQKKLVHAILQTALVRDAKGNHIHCINQIVDITERKRIEEQLLYDALHDALTGLPNRAFFKERLEYALKRAKRDKNYLFAVLFIDLDRFKIINDSLGHLVGDRMIVAIGNKLQKILRNTDIIARFGGDEFTILLDGIKDIKEVNLVTERICKIMRSPFKIDAHEVFTTASIGIALSSTGYEQASDILRDADIAVYRAKELGKDRYEVFDKEMHARAIKILQLENNLRKALENQEFKLNYQPIISLQTGCLVGFEALVRWQHPQQGLIPPTEFIPLAEETGSIVPIGEWILQEACHQMHAWQNQFTDNSRLKISVNISSKQIKDYKFIDKLDRILQKTQLNGKNLKLEITESVLMENAEAATKILLELRNRDIELSIDDFGTGYSSLSYLHKFPVNTLKIDRSFVSRMQPDRDNCEIVRAILTLAHTLGMDAIAEGIETAEQLQQLKLLGCEQGQGYYFSKPLDPEAATNFISTSRQ